MTRAMLGLALAALLSMPVGAADAPPPSETVARLSDSAQRLVVQDRLRAVLRVELGDPDPRQVQGEVNRRMAAAVAKAKDVAGVAVETGRYYVYEERQPNRPRRWVGTQTLTLLATEATPVLSLVGQLQADGLLASNLAYELSPELRRRIERELIPDAVGRVREKVEALAQAMSLKTVRYIEIKLRDGGGTPMMRAMPMMAQASAERAAAPPTAEPGDVTVSVLIEADVALSK
jgi:predicted secreted protein